MYYYSTLNVKAIGVLYTVSCFLLKLIEAGLKPSEENFFVALSALEDWDENPGAFAELYKATRKYYPKLRICSDSMATHTANDAIGEFATYQQQESSTLPNRFVF